MNLIKALFSRRWWWVTLLVVVGMGVLARLGVWQLDRLQERRAANVLLQQALNEPPLAITADFTPTDLSSLKDHLVLVQGEYDFAYQGIIKLQNLNGRAGVYVVAPLVLAGQTAVLVNRGWIPDADTDKLSQWDEPGPVTVQGYVALSETLRHTSTSTTDELAWYRVDIDQIQAQLPYQLLPFYVVEWSEEGETADLPLHLPREVDLSEGPHLGYALQWFTFCLMLGIGYLFFVRRSLNE
ncbi:MAG: SURF1 family protein [Ardenticatenaceae bacterium]|nr:SURF1 family protein [Ardenticatenaceae bacterium]